MKITANQDFLHHRVRYTAGESYDVGPALAGYFVGNGWADPDEDIPGFERKPQPANVDLQIDSSTLGHTSEVSDA